MDSLPYESAPRYGTLNVVQTDDGVSITAKPSRRQRNGVFVYFITVVLISIAVCVTLWVAKVDYIAFVLAAGLIAYFTVQVSERLRAVYDIPTYTADAHQLILQKRKVRIVWPRIDIIDLLALPPDANAIGFAWCLQLRLRNGQNLPLGRGEKQEIELMVNLLCQALGFIATNPDCTAQVEPKVAR